MTPRPAGLPALWSRAAHAGLAALGYLLSPLSWWNDAVVNLPLAYAFGAAAELLFPGRFAGAVIVGYWLTNVAGLVMLHSGAGRALCRTPPCRYTRRMLLRDLAVSVLYTVAIAALVWGGVLRPPAELLGRG
ncbi:MAG: hypothetical protein SCH98_00250 [Deferrisomatales bacterium]|nr:hypothetical protein [Deferrisomatales bacterium]